MKRAQWGILMFLCLISIGASAHYVITHLNPASPQPIQAAPAEVAPVEAAAPVMEVPPVTAIQEEQPKVAQEEPAPSVRNILFRFPKLAPKIHLSITHNPMPVLQSTLIHKKQFVPQKTTMTRIQT